ncbi:5-formyltetrahydrofolate cyclo-ligase [Agrococcus sp. SGAir0287]|uniref:5-formyltetrahydrofolate cyclo-ligase n=1 Tax=Agrococcus sp. SGAir0287 TaxID=2070347 RepID=UPI0010CCBCEC|nr:5-formyltetrahydrofolate cyclo-ligase [Agrococcus sp. SGAir0287]QCR19875.1 5-formyltetrahydrofolate cyclo-ligase [Agrococcus sp. SGAir0287]
MVDVVGEKRAIRERVRASRRARSDEERRADDAAIADAAIALLEELGARDVAAYLSLPDEPGTDAILAWARDHGVRVLLPIARQDGLLDWAEQGEAIVEGAFGLPEPTGEVLPPTVLCDVDVILAPASAVDARGMRMGWGRGYFDKALGALGRRPPVYALVHDDEILDAVPAEAHDQPVDGILSPSGRRTF